MTPDEWWEKIDRDIAEGRRCGKGDAIQCANFKPCPEHDLHLDPVPRALEKAT